ncbi:MAG: translation initiation factor IF-2 [Candidatus Aenigmatarchaeota archaeon]|nr:MAG: translation initiation factor IF-2 [Candidatus Aenigmarchaeota archaeon]
MGTIRQPIICILGHVDSGKTTLLDKIRGSAVAKSEHGGITQHIGASEIPLENIRAVCGKLIDSMGIDIKIPGLLFIDTPGHEAFTTLRRRGGAIADLAVLVIDINEGFKEQTDESLTFLKEFKTPFIVAATKIDRIFGWHNADTLSFAESIKHQSKEAQNELEEKIYRIVADLATRGFSSERFDRVKDFTKEVAIVPVSGVTGEGVAELIMLLAGLSQKFLEDRLEIKSETGKGAVLEVKEVRGLGVTIDVILYDGLMKKGDILVIGGDDIIISKIKALLKPAPLRELRVEKRFLSVDEVSAAAGVKVVASNLENVIAGLPFRSVRDAKQIDRVKEELLKEVEEVEIETENEGVIVKADTLGSLEALVKILKEINVPIRKAKVGDVSKSDVMESHATSSLIFAFNVSVPQDVKLVAKDMNVKIFSSKVIYRLIEDYENWVKEEKQREEEEILRNVSLPARIKVLSGYVFRYSNPAIFGVEVLAGRLRPGVRLAKNNKLVGEVKELQSRGENIEEAKAGEKVAISMPDVTIGRQVKEGDILETYLTRDEIELLERIRKRLGDDEIKLLEELDKR